MIEIDGSEGEGGGQILRTALGLSLCTGRAFRIRRIRANRDRPGLMRQHLAAVHAAARVGGARVDGDRLGSQELGFEPGEVRAGDFEFSIGTAGSTTLVFQTILPALLRVPGPSRITFEGGTHNPLAPPFDFLDRAFLPLVRRMGPRIEARLERPGFFPAGGGRWTVEVAPADRIRGFDLIERGAPRFRLATAVVARLPSSIGARETARIRERLGWRAEECQVREAADSAGPGNVILLDLAFEHVHEVVAAFGEKGRPAEAVADAAAAEAEEYLAGDPPAGRHLADQLLVPLALAGGGSFRTLPPTGHTLTNARTIERFLPVCIGITGDGGGSARVTVSSV